MCFCYAKTLPCGPETGLRHRFSLIRMVGISWGNRPGFPQPFQGRACARHPTGAKAAPVPRSGLLVPDLSN